MRWTIVYRWSLILTVLSSMFYLMLSVDGYNAFLYFGSFFGLIFGTGLLAHDWAGYGNKN